MMRKMMWLCLALVATGGCAAGTPPAREASAQRGAEPAELFARGRELARGGDALRGEQYMVMAVRMGYPERRAIVEIVGACLASARLRAALAHARPFVRRNPGAWQVRQLVGAIHLALGELAQARAELLRVLRARPDAAEAHYLLALIAHGLDDTTGARDAYAAYLALAPSGVHAAEARAWLQELFP